MAPGKSPKVTTSPKVATLKKVTSPASTLFPRPFPWPGKRSWERGWPSPLPTPLPEIWPERPCCEITSRYHIVPRASPVKAGVLLRVCRCRKETERIPCFYDITVRKETSRHEESTHFVVTWNWNDEFYLIQWTNVVIKFLLLFQKKDQLPPFPRKVTRTKGC